jgi:hypothetical protein
MSRQVSNKLFYENELRGSMLMSLGGAVTQPRLEEIGNLQRLTVAYDEE